MTRISKNAFQKKKISSSIPLDFRIEIMPNGRGYRVLISGVRSVRSFSNECIIVRLRRRSLKIVGDGLDIASLEENVVQISGNIKEFELVYDKY